MFETLPGDGRDEISADINFKSHPSRQFSERDCECTLCWAGDFADEQPLVDGTATGGGATLLARPSGIQRAAGKD